MGRRHLARELALKVLFELESDGGDAERSLTYHVAESHADAEVADFARTLIQGVRQHQPEIDAQLAEAAELERTVQQLGKEQDDLAESVRAFERGLALARRCARLLDDAERRVNQLAPAGERPPGL